MNIRERSPGVWQCVWLEGKDPITGKWKRRWETVEGTKAEAEAYWYRIRRQIDQGTAIDRTTATISDWMAEWLTRHPRPLRPRTKENYQDLIQAHIIPALGHIRLQELRAPMVQSAIERWRVTPRKGQKTKTGEPPLLLSARTVRYCYDLLRMALDQAVQWQLLERNVARMVTPPPTGKRVREEWWSADDAAKFLAATRETRWGLLWWLTLMTGLRLGEIRGLQWTDIDWTAKTVTVHRTLDRKNQPGPPKTAKGHRTLVLDDGTMEFLRERHQSAAADWVIATKNGTPVGDRNVGRAFQRAIEKVGVPDIPFHSLRHTNGSLLAEGGEDDRIIADRLGHTQISFTKQVYIHAAVERQRVGANRLAARLRQNCGEDSADSPQ